jgi:hypothetical protein
VKVSNFLQAMLGNCSDRPRLLSIESIFFNDPPYYGISRVTQFQTQIDWSVYRHIIDRQSLVYCTISFKSTWGVMHDPFYLFDIPVGAKILRDTSKIWGSGTEFFRNSHLFGIFRAIFGLRDGV